MMKVNKRQGESAHLPCSHLETVEAKYFWGHVKPWYDCR